MLEELKMDVLNILRDIIREAHHFRRAKLDALSSSILDYFEKKQAEKIIHDFVVFRFNRNPDGLDGIVNFTLANNRSNAISWLMAYDHDNKKWRIT